MSHNLNFTRGKTSFFAARECAWHGLGTITKEAQTSEQAIKLAQLDYEVGLAPIYADVFQFDDKLAARNGVSVRAEIGEENNVKYFQSKEVLDRYATYRKDTNDVFGIVGSRYEIVQNSQAFDFFDNIVGTKQAIFETAGALGNGETIFITAKLPDTFTVKNKDVTEQYLLFTNTHDGTGSIQVFFTPVRVVCNNTLSMALYQAKNKFTIRHTKSAHDKLKMAEEILGITKKTALKYHSELVRFIDVPMTEQNVLHYVSASLGILPKEDEKISTKSQNVLNNVMTYYYDGLGQSDYVGTLYGAYNAISGYFQNVKVYKDRQDKFNSILLGTDSNKIQSSLVKARELAFI